MKPQITFTLTQTVLLMFSTFYWGGSVTQYITGYMSILPLSLHSATALCVITVVVLVARKRS
jgi:hypothetical protein